jgi:hypothetical protein
MPAPAHLQQARVGLAVIRVPRRAKGVHHMGGGHAVRAVHLSLERARDLLELWDQGAAGGVHVDVWGAHIARADQLGADAPKQLHVLQGLEGLGRWWTASPRTVVRHEPAARASFSHCYASRTTGCRHMQTTLVATSHT